MKKYYILKQCEIGSFDKDKFSLMTNLNIMIEMMENLPKDSSRRSQVIYELNKVINIIESNEKGSIENAIQITKKFLSYKNGDSRSNISVIGHCHIDIAWLWTYAETRRKIARSWSTQILLMEQFKDYKFVQSQAQLYEWCKTDYPNLYQIVKEKIKTGQFIPQGGTFVEMDGNVPSGESFIRQFLYGQQFFKKEFGVICDVFWLPDTFGYSPQLPQIILGSGMKYFVTQKLSWNSMNKFPHSTFYWEGIDGTKVLSHFPPGETYNSRITIDEIIKSETNNQEPTNEALLLFGHGDGGGGPTREQIERINRLKDVDGLPKVSIRTPTEFFERVPTENLPKWTGELYLELHRGTFTSQSETKKSNRKCEFLLRDVEIMYFLAREKISYPQEELTRLWKILLLNQFHDVLPGSSIEMVYQDVAKLYKEIEESCEKLIINLTKKSDDISFVNTFGWERKEIIELLELNENCEQTIKDSKSLAIVSVNSFGSNSKFLKNTSQVKVYEEKENIIIENGFIRCKINKDGTIQSIFKKKEKTEMLKSKGNQFILYDDMPRDHDAWDVDIYHLQKYKEISAKSYEIIEKGPLRCVISFDYSFRKSKMKNQIILTSISERIDFQTHIEWLENRKILKVQFPVNIKSSVASYDIQFGYVERPTHFNTSYEVAKFEVCGHKWINLSEYNNGVALLNDCKYGHSIHGNLMSISLLRAPKSPDQNCDMGNHSFKYSFLLHNNDIQKVIKESYNFNNPLRILNGKFSTSLEPYIQIDNPSIILESIKKSEDTNKWIIRLFESCGGTSKCLVKFTQKIKSISMVNFIETEVSPLEFEDNSIELTFKPFEIINLSIE